MAGLAGLAVAAAPTAGAATTPVVPIPGLVRQLVQHARAAIPASPALPNAAPATTQAYYNPVTPCRLFDTRPHTSAGVCAGATAFASKFSGGQQRTYRLPPSIPATATSVVLNVTAVDASQTTFISVYPGGTAKPLASNVNVVKAKPVANQVTVEIGAGRLVNFWNQFGTVDVIADLEGYYTPPVTSGTEVGLGYHPVTPCRAFDTRGGIVGPCGNSGTSRVPVKKVGKAGVTTIKLTGVGGLPSDGTLKAVAFNLTAVNASAGTFESVYPTGHVVPLSSSLNVSSGDPVANLVTVPVDSAGRVSIYNSAGTVNLLGDIAGYYTTGTGLLYNAVTPCRVFDSRVGNGDCLNAIPEGPGMIDPEHFAPIPFHGVTVTPPNSATVVVPGVAGTPTDASAVVLNATVVDATKPTFLSVFPATLQTLEVLPAISNINPHNAAPVANQLVVQVPSGVADLDVDGDTDPTDFFQGMDAFYNQFGRIDLVVDLAGYYAPKAV
jgi:hypothetical protein